MKPIKLEIEGLNSFENKQVLEFEKVSKGVFGIFGKTGSGKSTILDAITLALYGEVQRSKQNIDFINTKRRKTFVSLEFEIFLSGEKKRFEVTRTFSIKKNGKDVESSATLYEINGEEKVILTEGTIKVNDKILDIIGLGKNEFIKCIALPQGEFSAFLNARESERTEILSNIFDLSKYGDALYRKVKDRVNDFEMQVNGLTSSLSMVDYATDEELIRAKQKYDEFNDSYKKEKSNLSEKTNLYSKLSNSLEKKKKLDKINAELEKFESQRDEFDKLESEISKNQSANLIKADYEKLVKGEIDEKELNSKLVILEGKLALIENEHHEENAKFSNFKLEYDKKIEELTKKISQVTSLTGLENEKIDLENSKKELTEKLENENKSLEFELEKLSYIVLNLNNIEAELEKIDDFIEAHKSDVDLSYALEQTKGIESEIILIDDSIKKIEAVYDLANEELTIANAEYGNSIKQEKKLTEKISQIQNSINVAFEDIDKTNFNKIRSCDKQLEGMNGTEIKTSMIEELISKLILDKESRQASVAMLSEKIANLSKNLEIIAQKIEEKENFLKNERERREELIGANFFALSSNAIKIGDDCPYCGSRVIQKTYEQPYDLTPIEKEIFEEEQGLKELQTKKEKMLADFSIFKARSQFERTQIEIDVREIDSLTLKKNELFGEYVEINEHTRENFQKLYTLLQETSEKLEKLIDLQDMLREEHQNVIINKSQSGTKIAIYRDFLEKLNDILYNLNTKKAEREIAILNVNEKYSNLKEYKKQVAEGKNIELVIEEKKEKKFNLKEGQTKILIEKSNLESNIAKINSNIAVLNEKIANISVRIDSIAEQIKTNGVSEGRTISDEEKDINIQIEVLKEEYRKKEMSAQSCKELLNRTENEFSISKTIMEEKLSEIAELREKINLAILENKFSDAEELEKYFAPLADIKEKQARLNEFKTQYQLLENQKRELEVEDYENVNEDKVQQMKLDLDLLSDNVQELSIQVGRTSAEFEKLEADNKVRNEIAKNLAETNHKFSLAKELASVLKGKALAEYVAEEYLHEITELANQKLNILLDGRYNLRFENKDFVVEDNFNDGLLRSASTLSGGETFLVSLSLALAISESISLLSSRTIDFFFLDEGFGTLDSELCEIVVSALQKLESQNLNIGLISHVGELEESVKNKILVTKTSNGSKLEIAYSL